MKKNKELIWFNGNLKACDDVIINFDRTDEKGRKRGTMVLFWNDYKDCAKIKIAEIDGLVCILPSKPLKYELK